MKNKSMRLAALFLVLTLITSCFVGGTFSKYVTADEGADAARVAKWGVELAVEGNVFSDTYATDDATYAEINSVVASDNVVAPGTSGEMAAISLSGTPEVAVNINYDADLNLAGWLIGEDTVAPGEPIGEWVALGWTKIAGTSVDFPPNSKIPAAPTAPGAVDGEIAESEVVPFFHYAKASEFVYKWQWVLEGYGEPITVPAPYYCPIVITVGETAYSGLDYDSMADFEAAVEAAIEAASADYAAGTDLSEIDVPAVSWSWAFESENDAYDTVLGDQAAADNAATIDLALTVTATQID